MITPGIDSPQNQNEPIEVISKRWQRHFCLSNAYDLIHPYEHQIKKTDKFLDVGCGDGFITAWLAEKVPLGYVWGVDVLESAIHAAKRKYAKCGNLNFNVSDACDLDVPGKFNWIVAFNSLHWIDEVKQLRFLTKAKEILTENGKLLFTLGLRHEPICSIIDQVASETRWSAYLQSFSNPRVFFTPRSYASLIEKAGLHISSLKTSYKTHSFSSQEEFEHCVISWLPQADLIPGELRQIFIREISSSYLKSCPINTNSEVEITFTNLEVAAVSIL